MTSMTTSVLPTGTWRSDHTHSHAGFAIRAVGTFRGAFETLDATLVVDDEGGVRLTGSVAADSIQVKNDQLRAHLGSPDFFDVARYPELRFTSTAVEREGADLRLEGQLTIRDQTHAIDARGTVRGPVTALDGAVRLGLAFETVINRTDYGVSWNVPMPAGGTAIGEEVTITVDLDLVLTVDDGHEPA